MSRRWIAPAVALVAVSALAVAVRPSSRLEAAEVERPNIVFILTDDQRWDTIRGIMPVVETEILGRGLEFRNAFATNPLCCPSRASILTGNYAHTHGVWENFNGPNGGFAAFDDSSTIATWLHDGGYYTGLIGKYMNGYQVSGGTYIPPGWDEWYTLMDGDYYRFTVTDNGVQKYIPAQYSTDTFAFEAKTFIQHAPVDQPLFLMFNPRAPHGPYTPATRHDEAFADMAPYRSPSWQERDVRDKPRWLQKIEPAGAPRVKQYDREQIDSLESLLAVDEAIGSLLDALEQSGRLENTLIIYASDNGYEWGEHRLWGKNIPYDASLRLPLIMRWDAGILPATSTSNVVANIDLAPTIAEIAGVTPPARVDGRSLTRFFADPGAAFGRKGILIEHAQGGKLPAYCGYRTEGELFVHYASGDEEYYRYSKDPYELENRALMPSEQFEIAKVRSIARSRCAPMPPGMSWS